MREFTAVSLFCGAGGLDMGFDRAGFRTIWANDFDADACKTHQNWSKANVVCGDISKVADAITKGGYAKQMGNICKLIVALNRDTRSGRRSRILDILRIRRKRGLGTAERMLLRI